MSEDDELRCADEKIRLKEKVVERLKQVHPTLEVRVKHLFKDAFNEYVGELDKVHKTLMSKYVKKGFSEEEIEECLIYGNEDDCDGACGEFISATDALISKIIKKFEGRGLFEIEHDESMVMMTAFIKPFMVTCFGNPEKGDMDFDLDSDAEDVLEIASIVAGKVVG